MDQDVEAILNASDSEEDDNLNVQGVSLEDILREDDGGDTYLPPGGGIGYVGGEDPPHLGSRCRKQNSTISTVQAPVQGYTAVQTTVSPVVPAYSPAPTAHICVAQHKR